MQHGTVPKIARSGESFALPSEFVPDFRGQVCREDRLIALPGSLVVLERQTCTGHGHAGTRRLRSPPSVMIVSDLTLTPRHTSYAASCACRADGRICIHEYAKRRVRIGHGDRQVWRNGMARVDGHLGPVVAGVAPVALRGDVGILGRDGAFAKNTGQICFLVRILRRRRGP
jgi:hypothetical protein